MSGLGTRRKGKSERWELNIPEYLALRVETLCADPGTKKPVYGFRSQLVTELLEAWASAREKELISNVNVKEYAQ